jgi:hypothetical protein
VSAEAEPGRPRRRAEGLTVTFSMPRIIFLTRRRQRPAEWRSAPILLKHYEQPDGKTLLAVVMGGVELREPPA